MKSDVIETIIGAAVIVAAGAFFVFARGVTGAGAPTGSYRVTAEFDNISGISVGTDVKIAGVKVGKVVSQTLDPKSYQARIEMMLNPEVQLSDDTSAKISSEGLLGSSYVQLDPGGSEEKLKDGSVISYTQGPLDLWKLISQAMFSKSESKPATEGTTQAP